MGRGKSADASEFWKRFDAIYHEKDLVIESSTSIPSSTISSYRSGKRFPRANEAIELARIAETTVEYLVNGTEPSTISPPEMEFHLRARKWKNVIDDLESMAPPVADGFCMAIHTAAQESRIAYRGEQAG